MRFAPVMRANARQARTIRRLNRLVERQSAEIEALRAGHDPRSDGWTGQREHFRLVRTLEKVNAELRRDNAALQRQADLLMEWCPSDLRELDVEEADGGNQ